MLSYTYKFVWLDKNKNENVKYIYAASMVDAKQDFKETFGFEPKPPQVLIKRLTGADN